MNFQLTVCGDTAASATFYRAVAEDDNVWRGPRLLFSHDDPELRSGQSLIP